MLSADLELARRFLAAHPPSGDVLLCAVSGAHLYGFPSPDSDLDLKGIHLAPTRSLLGLAPVAPTHDVLRVVDSVEYDLTTNEAAAAFALLLAGNGNMLERMLSPLQVVATAELSELQDLARRSVSRRFSRHYAGFFRGRCSAHDREPTAKSMLYAYRVALTGTHLLRTGRLECNLTVLAEDYGFGSVQELVALKRERPEHGLLPPQLDAVHRARWPELEALLVTAFEESTLPDEAPTAAELASWLVETRLRRL